MLVGITRRLKLADGLLASTTASIQAHCSRWQDHAAGLNKPAHLRLSRQLIRTILSLFDADQIRAGFARAPDLAKVRYPAQVRDAVRGTRADLKQTLLRAGLQQVVKPWRSPLVAGDIATTFVRPS